MIMSDFQKSKRHSNLLSQTEYVWDLNTTKPVYIELEYEKINIHITISNSSCYFL